MDHDDIELIKNEAIASGLRGAIGSRLFDIRQLSTSCNLNPVESYNFFYEATRIASEIKILGEELAVVEEVLKIK
jgi:hypothetical protein